MFPEREKYLQAAKSQLDPKIFTHSLALEACMGGLYDYFQSHNLLEANEPPKSEWLLSGLIHDLDYSEPFKEYHPNRTNDALSTYGLTVNDSIISIIKSHSPKNTGVNPTSKAQWSIFCADSLTGLIMAVAYVYPSQKLADVKLSSVLKRFLKEPRFAAGTRREEVSLCSNLDGLNLTLEDFTQVCLTSMQAIAPELGL